MAIMHVPANAHPAQMVWLGVWREGDLVPSSRLSHRVTGSTGSERPAPAPVPVHGTGRYRPAIGFLLVPHTDRPTGLGWLLRAA
jgi:hypothetical protein